MIKKISIIILSAGILVTGCFAFCKLSYYERSTRIFSINNSEQTFERRIGRGPGEIERRDDRNIPDSLAQQFRRNEGDRTGRGQFGGGMGRRDGHGRDEFSGGGKISLRNVGLFLAVFAGFTVIAVYAEKAICFVRKR